MARIEKTGNAKLAKAALARAKKGIAKFSDHDTTRRKQCKVVFKALTEAAAHTGAAVHGNEKAKGLHKQLHSTETRAIQKCLLSVKACPPCSKPRAKPRAKPPRRRRAAQEDWYDSDLFVASRSSPPASSRTGASVGPRFYAPASGSGSPTFTREQFNRAAGFAGLRRRRK